MRTVVLAAEFEYVSTMVQGHAIRELNATFIGEGSAFEEIGLTDCDSSSEWRNPDLGRFAAGTGGGFTRTWSLTELKFIIAPVLKTGLVHQV